MQAYTLEFIRLTHDTHSLKSEWHSVTVIRSTSGNTVPVAVTNLETSSLMEEALRRMIIINLPDHGEIDSVHPRNSRRAYHSWFDGVDCPMVWLVSE
ncbi:hypothetical protein JTB14_012543 [Gonioctena quinquepunctata]|nr:hypothetical protein JTB14_012543 [Gonioctena quinquepunctata]